MNLKARLDRLEQSDPPTEAERIAGTMRYLAAAEPDLHARMLTYIDPAAHRTVVELFAHCTDEDLDELEALARAAVDADGEPVQGPR